ncbi:hypothetical protein MRS44_001986 [Fusarium solani]|uniref:uncharacterized protein n=1 Tax=Fusarium solani TaxID=169388 RepID=UPI0032C457D9|nr:hypothetical protein MRS44_001986 [Fusarium solani]
MSSRPLLPLPPRFGPPSTSMMFTVRRAASSLPSIQQCFDLHHLHVNINCGVCDKELSEGSYCMIIYSKTFPRGPWNSVSTRVRLRPGHTLWQGDGLCFCSIGRDKSLPPGAALTHLHCFFLFFGRSPPRAVFHHMRDRLATALTFRGFDKAPFNRHYTIRFPRDVSVAAFLKTAAQLGLGQLESLPNEVISIIARLYVGSPFLDAVRVMATSLELRAFTPHCVWFALQEVVSWKRGDAVPVLASPQSPQPGPARVTLDPRGICCIDRKTGGSPLHTQRFVRIQDGKGVKLYFKDGLAYLKRPEGHSWFQINEPLLTRRTEGIIGHLLPPPMNSYGHPIIPTQAQAPPWSPTQ